MGDEHEPSGDGPISKALSYTAPDISRPAQGFRSRSSSKTPRRSPASPTLPSHRLPPPDRQLRPNWLALAQLTPRPLGGHPAGSTRWGGDEE